jgi:hypothetical protein
MDPAGGNSSERQAGGGGGDDEDPDQKQYNNALRPSRERGTQKSAATTATTTATTTTTTPRFKDNTTTTDRTDAPPPPSSRALESADMEVARRFLADEKVQAASKSQKIRFLRAKGLREDQIDLLLRESESRAESKDRSTSTQDALVETKGRPDPDEQQIQQREQQREPPREQQQQQQQQQQPQHHQHHLPVRERAPIVTYPEFLARAKEPRPLITPDTIFNSIYALAGVSALVYGANALVVEPMTESLNDARHDLYSTTSRNLDELIRKLESIVSVVPPPAAGGGGTSSSSAALTRQRSGTETTGTADDITSPASTLRRERSPFNNTAYDTKGGPGSHMALAGSRLHTDRLPDEPTHNLHARWVGRLAASASLLRVDLDGQTESMVESKAAIDSFTADLEKMIAQSKKYSIPGQGGGIQGPPPPLMGGPPPLPMPMSSGGPPSFVGGGPPSVMNGSLGPVSDAGSRPPTAKSYQ